MDFWKWFDRAARADFAGNLLDFIFGWKRWLLGLLLPGGGGMTFLWAAIDGRSPLDVWVLAVVVVAALTVILFVLIFLADRHHKLVAGSNTQASVPGPAPRRGTTGILVSGKDNTFSNVDAEGFDTGFEFTEMATGNTLRNVRASAHPRETSSIDRIPCTELLKIATAVGWDFTSSASLQLLDMQEAMRQGGSDDVLIVWGRSKKWTSDELMRKELLVPIPPSHWLEFFVHLFAARDDDNFNTYSWEPSKEHFGRRGYVDLHVDRHQAIAWLRRDAAPFRGKTKPR
jgi:hypothetical protein